MQRDALALSDVWDVAPHRAVLGVLVDVGNVAVRGGGDGVTLQIGDKVRLNGTLTWVVAGQEPAWVYLTNPDWRRWAPIRVPPADVTHVWRGNEWVPVSPAEAG